MDEPRAFQDRYPEDLSHCYGCGRMNDKGLQIKSYWDGEESVCSFTPRPEHMAIPGMVYGGLIASVIDCHGTGTAAAAAFRAAGAVPGTEGDFRFVTASLHVDYVAPTPLGPPMELRAVVEEIKGRKVVISETLSVNGTLTAKGRVVAVRIPAP
jgi:acyl-coenzyme A thioesterase PaaI-like protein